MNCPICKKPLDKSIINKVEVDVCPMCLGMWLEKNELRWIKDEEDKNLNWLDIDLWKNEIDFQISRGKKLCPKCRLPLYEVEYGDSGIKVDVCNICHGLWLDRGEFRKIVDYLKEEKNKEILEDYTKNLSQEGFEVLIGPETIREEAADFLTVLKLLRHKIGARHPHITKLIADMPE